MPLLQRGLILRIRIKFLIVYLHKIYYKMSYINSKRIFIIFIEIDTL